MLDKVVCLEDEPRSIEDQLGVIQEFGLKEKVFGRPRELGGFLAHDVKDPDVIGAFVLDMHINGIKNLAEIELPDVKTADGLAVGLAVAEKFLRARGSKFKNIPVAILTGFKMDKAVARQWRAFEAREKKVTLLFKDDEDAVGKFRRFMTSILPSNANEIRTDRKLGKHLTRHSKVSSLAAEKLRLALKALEGWGLSARDAAIFFGYRVVDAPTWGDLQRALLQWEGTDAIDRAELIIELRISLEATIGPNLREQARWLNAKLGLLGGESPMAVIRGGHLFELGRVVELIVRVRG